MAQKRSWWLTNPSVSYRKDPWFYFKYDGAWLVLMGGISVALYASPYQGLFTEWTPWMIPALLIAIYVQVMAGVFIHNCTHVNFPRSINRLVGEVCGLIVGTRYASWEILHQQHHKYSDDRELDPHPVQNSFWMFVWEEMIGNLESNMHMQYYGLYGDTPKNRRREIVRSVLSFGTMVVLFAFWWSVLGWLGFLAVYVPAQTIGILHVSHFNWSTHDAKNPDGDFKPVNLNHGFFKIGNRLWFGLYFHANHHRYVGLFNPMHLDEVLAKKQAAARASEADEAELLHAARN
jgi:stearoyl-CoA desaturase (delta-9 desaturase)